MQFINRSVNWFEIPVADFARAKKFYNYILNNEMPTHIMGNTLMGFLHCNSYKINGAICYGESYFPSRQGVLVYLTVGNDLDDVLNRVMVAGGQVLLPKKLISTAMGYVGKFYDCEGNCIGLYAEHQ